MPSRPASVSLIHRRCSGPSAAPGREDNPSTEPHPLTSCSMSEHPPEGEDVPVRVAHADLSQAVALVDGPVHEIGTELAQLLVEGVDVVDVEIDVEHVRRHSFGVRAWARFLEAGEMNLATVARRLAVVPRLPHLDVESELVSVVVERLAEVVDEQYRSVACDPHARARARISCTT